MVPNDPSPTDRRRHLPRLFRVCGQPTRSFLEGIRWHVLGEFGLCRQMPVPLSARVGGGGGPATTSRPGARPRAGSPPSPSPSACFGVWHTHGPFRSPLVFFFFRCLPVGQAFFSRLYQCCICILVELFYLIFKCCILVSYV